MMYPVVSPGSPAAPLTDPRATAPIPLHRRRVLEVGLAPYSESNLVAGFRKIEGVFVATWTPPPIGAAVDLDLTFPGRERIRVPGRVEWHREPAPRLSPGVGVRFGRLSLREASLLARFARNRQPYFYDAGSP